MVVTETGMQTQMGQIATMLSSVGSTGSEPARRAIGTMRTDGEPRMAAANPIEEAFAPTF